MLPWGIELHILHSFIHSFTQSSTNFDPFSIHRSALPLLLCIQSKFYLSNKMAPEPMAKNTLWKPNWLRVQYTMAVEENIFRNEMRGAENQEMKQKQ